jgi:four helix bundle protein
MRNYKQLDAWKEAMKLIKAVYDCSRNFPKDEMYGLTSQARRAAVSIAANIAEGMGRHHKKDTNHFLHIARGSIYELETLLNVAVMNKILLEKSNEELQMMIDKCVMILSGLINYYEKSESLK